MSYCSLMIPPRKPWMQGTFLLQASIIDDVRQAYKPFGQVTDTLITKVILGTFGCLPACDRYFIEGFRSAGYEYSKPNDKFVERIFGFCYENLHELQKEQASIKQKRGFCYPLMRLVDMYFWKVGRYRASRGAH